MNKPIKHTPEVIETARFHDWPDRLVTYMGIESQNPTFEWGVRDCCTFAAGAVEAIMGVDYIGGLRGQYHSREEADEMFFTEGYGDLNGFLIAKFGQPEPPMKGARGDIAVFEGCLGIVMGTQAVFLTEGGIALLRLNKIEHVFKVPL